MSIPSLLDHIVIAGPDLPALVDWFAERTGVVAAPGGAHPTGTANALVALTIDGQRGPQYIELIGPNPDREDPAVPTTFGIDGLTEPAVQAYAVHPADIDAVVAGARSRGFDPGDVWELSRRTPAGDLLEWRLTGAALDRLDVPFLIDWGTTTQPGLSDLPTLELVRFVRAEVDAAAVQHALDALDLGDGVTEVIADGSAGYRLELRRADGETVSF
ncbi:VOC family protein [Leucobacter japonicus]|uniref:VOC family protein n=1 Tax=Leucobacter japonicus TaxID=1461259 RepID=UPI0006A7DC4F|nr:VOC family protein [Leucobacter japonicus]